MTSEPDSTLRRRPPTIDLSATEVEADKPAAAEQAGASAPAAGRTSNTSSGRLKHHALGAVGGALVMAAIVAGLWFAGYAPTRKAVAPPSAPGATPNATDQIAAQLAKIQASLQAQQPDAALASRLAAAEAATKSLGDSVAALTHRVDDVATAAQSALAQAQAAAAAAGAAKNAAQAGVQHGDFDALTARVAALESAIKTLTTDVAQQTSGANDRAARLTVAATALRATVERGAPYQAELAAVKSLGVDQNAAAPLEAFAATGVPSTTALANELAALVPALRNASSPAAGQNTLVARLENSAKGLVRITPIEAPAPAGDDPSSVIARINADAARADVSAALADIAKLPDAEKALATTWVQKASARNAAITASQQIAANTLAALGKPASQ